MSKTSATVKNRYRDKTYRLYQMQIRQDGQPNMDDIKVYADRAGESLNHYIYTAICQRMTSEGYSPTADTDS